MSRFPEKRITSWQEFAGIADKLDFAPAGQLAIVSRGQADSAWSLVPSFNREIRDAKIGEEDALKLEKVATATFREQSYHHISTNELIKTTDIVSWWTLMQHHGVPTRLLDWSASIYVSAYFAVTGEPKKDGGIWVVDLGVFQRNNQEKYGQSEVTLSKGVAEAEKETTSLNAPPIVVFFKRNHRSDRMIAQQGLFSVCKNILGDQDEIICNICGHKVANHVKLVIPAELKPYFARRLRSMNITAASLFPGLDGLSRSVKELIQLGVNDAIIAAAPQPTVEASEGQSTEPS